MLVGVWRRLDLRWQVGAAVLVPFVAVALMNARYFQPLHARAALGRLEAHALSVGLLAAEAIDAALRTPDPAALERLLARVEEGGGVLGQAVAGPGGVLAARGLVPALAADAPPAPLACRVEPAAHASVLRCGLGAGRQYVATFSHAPIEAEVAAMKPPSIVITAGVALATLALAFLMARSISAPVGRMTRVAGELARGQVPTERLEAAASAELSAMARSFNEMLEALGATVRTLVAHTAQLDRASQGLAVASAEQEQVISQQAAYAQQTSATFEELKRAQEQITTSTEVVESSARRTHEAVSEAMAVVARVVSSIFEIRAENAGAAEAIEGLNADLQQVGKIAQVINAVAERSDLLALNAALEGTKAGEVGRGFSLVAAEMRKLAEHVSASARDIARIVEKVQQSGAEAARRARGGMEASVRGAEVSEQARVLFQRIVELSSGTREAAGQITVATREQRRSSEEAVAEALGVAELVKRGVDATGRTHRIAQDLRGAAQALTDVTGRFKLADPPPRQAA
jgi:methyl-accepting chemotaxis protein